MVKSKVVQHIENETPWGGFKLELYGKSWVADGIEVNSSLLENMEIGEKHCVYRAYKAEYWPNFREYRKDLNAGASGVIHICKTEEKVSLSGQYVCWDKEFEKELLTKLDTIVKNCIEKGGYWQDEGMCIEGHSLE